MRFSKVKVAAVALAMAVSAGAQFNMPQNARGAALAGGSPMPDISDVYDYPVKMIGYADHIQATWHGGVVGVWTLGNVVSVGLLANQGLMAPRFAEAAADELNAFTGGAALGDQYNIPHLLLGFDFGVVSMGVDIFLEYARYSERERTAAQLDERLGGLLIHPGAKLSWGIALGDMRVLTKFGMGFPSASGEQPPRNSDRFSTETGLYMEAGVETALPVAVIGGVDLTIGAGYTRSDHRFRVGNTARSEAECNSIFRAYAGGEFNFVETAAAALQYEFARDAGTLTFPGTSGNQYATVAAHYHIFTVGAENIWGNAWILDAFHLRGGARYEVEALVGEFNVVDARGNFKGAGVHSGIVPTAGVGVSKKSLTLDLSLNMGGWGGLFIGPPAGLVTATIKF